MIISDADSPDCRAERLLRAAEFIAAKLAELPRVAIILGSGLGSLVDYIEDAVAIDYADIPFWQQTHAAGHSGQLVFGWFDAQPVIAMAGRFHRYEGYSTDQITFPVRVLAAIGSHTLIVSNAAGAVNPKFSVGDIVVIHDHIDWMHGKPSLRFDYGIYPPQSRSDAPLRGVSPYDPILCEKALETARLKNFSAYPGTYLATMGPNYETRAEYRMMRKLGADVVGMSTVPEVLQAQRIGMRVLALSMVSNIAKPDAPIRGSHAEVLNVGQVAEPRLRAIVREAVQASTTG
ncbi:MAG: purine-nucleoside phosphorylase [Pirellulaceae bacterium]